MSGSDPIADLRRMSPEELTRLGESSLSEHLLAQAVVAHCRHGPDVSQCLDALLQDPECVRHPTRLVFEFGEMGMHQFAQPDFDWQNQGQDGRVLYVRPVLRERPACIALAVAYMIPVINYGDLVTDTHCVRYGATLLGLTEAEFYARVCRLAEDCGAEVRMAGQDATCGALGSPPSPAPDDCRGAFTGQAQGAAIKDPSSKT